MTQDHIFFFLTSVMGIGQSWFAGVAIKKQIHISNLFVLFSCFWCSKSVLSDVIRIKVSRKSQKKTVKVRWIMTICKINGQARIQGGGAGAGAHSWDGKTRAEGAGFLVSRAEIRDTGVS